MDRCGGLYTVRFRHYDPVWGRWISRDPAGYADSMSLYGYGWGGPVSGSDPSGGDYYEWEDARGWKNGRRGTYHHQYRYVWHWYGLYYSREYVGSRFTADGDEIDDHGHSEYQRRVLQALNEGAGRVGDVANTTIAAAAILIVFVPGPEDVLVAMMAGVKFIKIGGKWFKVLADGTKTPADEAATSALEMAHFGERMKKLGYVENPHRAGSWGVYENGKFVEKARFDPAKPGAPGWGGKDHIHTDGGKDHLDPCTPVPGE